MVKLSSKTLALVIAAIKNMRESKGSSSKDILNYISSVYDIPQDVAKRQMVAALKRGVAHGILKKTDGYYSLPTDTEAECMEVAAQELGLLDLCCRKKKRESRKKKGGCKSMSSKRKKRASRKGKSRSKGCKSRSGRSKSKRRGKSSRRGKSRRGKSGKGCGCKSKKGGRSKRSKRSKRGKSRGCKPKRRPKRSKKMKCGEEEQKPIGKQCATLNIDVYDNGETDRRSVGRCRSKSKSRSCSRSRNVAPTA